MVNKPIDRQQRLEKFVQAVETAQQLQDNILKYGLNAAYLYYEDVDGDWLAKWGDEDAPSELITSFLLSNDLIALNLREMLQDKSISEISNYLDNCMNISTEENRVFAIKDLLISSINDKNGIDLLNLAQQLVDKLEDIIDINAR
ncbi:hypothetical protein NIES4071_28320 [Calothrix sp. NIES-4071]|nr:hypothetical protein NIES4071_28320 [Calothrix sp. NIES-4071]BAZ57154.1 hypothetical protein NIES4105_28260 [Calothrix sp. NIES-4105]